MTIWLPEYRCAFLADSGDVDARLLCPPLCLVLSVEVRGPEGAPVGDRPMLGDKSPSLSLMFEFLCLDRCCSRINPINRFLKTHLAMFTIETSDQQKRHRATKQRLTLRLFIKMLIAPKSDFIRIHLRLKRPFTNMHNQHTRLRICTAP